MSDFRGGMVVEFPYRGVTVFDPRKIGDPVRVVPVDVPEDDWCDYAVAA